MAKHPTQLYEALAYMVTFILVMFMYWKTKAKNKASYKTGKISYYDSLVESYIKEENKNRLGTTDKKVITY